MRMRNVCSWVGLATAMLPAPWANARAACRPYELRVPDGLKAGQSISIRIFGLGQHMDYTGEPIGELQSYTAEQISTSLKSLQRFSSVEVIPELGPARTDLVMEGVVTELNQSARIGTEGARRTVARARMRGSVRNAVGEEVLVFGCGEDGPLGFGSVQSRVRSVVRKLAEDIAELIVESERRTAFGFFDEEMLSATTEPWRSNSVAWSPASHYVAVAGEEGLIRLWDVRTSKLEAEAKKHADTVFSVAWSPDGKRLASGGHDKTVRLWEWEPGEPMTQMGVLSGHSHDVLSVCWSPDGKRLASASKDRSVRLWDADSHASGLVLVGHNGPVRSVSWSPDGSRIASCGEDRTIRLWDAAGRKEQAALKGHQGKVWVVAWSPDGKRLASASEDKTIRLWAAATGQEERVLQGHLGSVQFVSWSPDGTRLVSAGDTTVRLWDAAAGRELRILLSYGCAPQQTSLARRAAKGGVMAPLVLLAPSPPPCVSGTSWSPDGTRVAAVGNWIVVRRLHEASSPR